MFVDAALGEIVKKKKLPIGNWVVVVVVVVLERKKDRLFVYDFSALKDNYNIVPRSYHVTLIA